MKKVIKISNFSGKTINSRPPESEHLNSPGKITENHISSSLNFTSEPVLLDTNPPISNYSYGFIGNQTNEYSYPYRENMLVAALPNQEYIQEIQKEDNAQKLGQYLIPAPPLYANRSNEVSRQNSPQSYPPAPRYISPNPISINELRQLNNPKLESQQLLKPNNAPPLFKDLLISQTLKSPKGKELIELYNPANSNQAPSLFNSSVYLKEYSTPANDSYNRVIPMDMAKSFCTIVPKPQSTYETIEPSSKINQSLKLVDSLEQECKGFEVSPNIDSKVQTISECWLPIQLMANFGRFKKEFVDNIDKLLIENSIVGWKKSRGDGNCYYRAVITRYLEIIHKYYNPLSYIKKFIHIIKRTKQFRNNRGYDIANDEFVRACDNIGSFLKSMIKLKKEDPIKCFMSVLIQLQIEEFDKNLVKVARAITHYALYADGNSDKLLEFGIEREFYEQSIMTMGEEAEGITLLLLPIELGIQVIQFNIFKSVVKEEFPLEKQNIIVEIVRRGGHYDILYNIQEMELDQFRFSDGTYHFLNALARRD